MLGALERAFAIPGAGGTVPRDELTRALAELEKLIPDRDDGDSDAEWRAQLIKRYGSVTSFLGMLAQLELGAAGRRHRASRPAREGAPRTRVASDIAAANGRAVIEVRDPGHARAD